MKPDLNEAAAKRLRQAIRQLRGAKHSLAEGHRRMGGYDPGVSILAKRILVIEMDLLDRVAKLGESERVAE